MELYQERLARTVGRIVIGLVLISGSVFAQDPDAIRIETAVVNVGVSVTNRDGKSVSNLDKGDFSIFDDGREREVVLFSDDTSPVSYGFVYDLHSTTSDRTKRVLDSIDAFTKRLGERDDFFTIVFNERGSLVLDFVPSQAQVARHLSLGERGEPSSLYDSIFLAAEKAEERPNSKRTLIVITDGKDDDSHHSFKELSRRLKELNVQIFTVFVGDTDQARFSDLTLGKQPRALDTDLSLDRAALDEISEASGGRSQEPVADNVVSLVGVYNRIAAEMRARYSLGFYADEPDGKWHKLEVKIRTMKGEKPPRLAYRRGYQSPKKQ